LIEILPYFKALSDETRLRLIAIMLNHELNVNELVATLAMGQSRVSRHLKILADSGLLSSRRDGLRVFYSAAQEGPGRQILEALEPLLGREPQFELDTVRAEEVIAERTRATQRFFEDIAGDWDKLKRKVLAGFDLSSRVAQRMPRGKVAVDLGCGTGDLLETLLERAGEVIGVDSSSRMLDLARQRFASDGAAVSLRIGELEHLPLADGEADFAVASMALHHLSRPFEGIEEAHRVLSRGGRFMIVDFEKHTNETMRKEYGDQWLGFSEEELGGWLEQAGFSLDESSAFPVAAGLTIRLVTGAKS
jgi:ubiquinone/menaquinone biosynthesis C-methylase UbiE